MCGTREVWRRLGIWRQGCAITPLPASQYSRQFTTVPVGLDWGRARRKSKKGRKRNEETYFLCVAIRTLARAAADGGERNWALGLEWRGVFQSVLRPISSAE